MELDDYYLIYYPATEEVLACDFFYGDESGRTYCSTIYLSDSETVDTEKYYYFELEAYNDTTTFISGSGTIRASTFCYDDDFSFSQYSGIAMNRTHDAALGQVMLVDSLDAAQYMFDDNGLPFTIEDFGFTEEYAEYWGYAA